MKGFVSVLNIKKVVCITLFVVFVVPAATVQASPLLEVTDDGGSNHWLYVGTNEAGATGWVGIGTNDPQDIPWSHTPKALLDIKGSGARLQVQSTDNERAQVFIYTQLNQPAGLFFGTNGNGGRFVLSARGGGEGHDFRLYRSSGGWEVMTAWDWMTGNVTIGQANPPPAYDTYKLYVNGTIANMNGEVTGSDLRWKKNVETLDTALGKVMSLRGVRYDWRADEFPTVNFRSGRQIGLVAQEVMAVLPELVSEMALPRQDTDPENINPVPEPVDETAYYGINYTQMIPILIEAMKEQQGLIDRQNAEIGDLKNRMAAVEAALQKLGVAPKE